MACCAPRRTEYGVGSRADMTNLAWSRLPSPQPSLRFRAESRTPNHCSGYERARSEDGTIVYTGARYARRLRLWRMASEEAMRIPHAMTEEKAARA